jgi:hypothetical protein
LKFLQFTLLTDGSSDRVLKPISELLLDVHCPTPYAVQHAEQLPSGALEDRIPEALRLYPCDVLLVHRDAERQRVEMREEEINGAMRNMTNPLPPPHHVCVIPVRMTEAWLLLDEAAIRKAAGNLGGRTPLELPPVERVESVDAKEILTAALRVASELGARRLRTFDVPRARFRVAAFIEDIRSLRAAPSFRHFESQLQSMFSHLTSVPR